ncbi:MAG TPA: TlpA disulfide reductase family protein [Pirellulales bacterium]|nr:TlpA disulfide reductase family protein [Pirellulales bacterium]
MSYPFAPLVMWLAVAAADDTLLQPGTQWSFRGDLAPVQRQRGPPMKNFDLTMWVIEADDSGVQLYWLVDERGQGQWPWIERFGRVALDPAYKTTGSSGPSLLYDFGTGKNVVPLLPPVMKTDESLAKGATWEQDALEFEVEGSANVGDRACWQIAVRNNFGRKRVVWLDKQSPLLVKLEETVFMDRGTEYELSWTFVGSEQLEPAAFDKLGRAFNDLIAVRKKLKRPTRTQSDEFSAEQRELLIAALPKLAAETDGGALAPLVQNAANELKSQASRAEAVATLREQFVDKPAPAFALEGLGGERLSAADLAGKVTVLHFWEYQNEPLKEPYGQIGYLEFLHGRRGGEGVQVMGVAVDARLKNQQTRTVAMASVRKLKEFMNLTYPILLDDGQVLRAFGDPRILGATLPLYVIIDRNGKVADYHVGLQPVDRQEGLKELDDLVHELATP